MVTEAFELIDRFEKAVDANGYRTRDKHTEEEYRAAKSALEAALSAAEPWPFEHQNYNCPCIHPSQCDESCVKKPAPSVAVKALTDAYKAGFDASSQGYNGEVFPEYEADNEWLAQRDSDLSALSAQVQDESKIIDCLLAGKPFIFDPATNFCHANDGGAPEHGIKYVPAAQVHGADEQRTETCQRCQGNGEIVTDWERYRHPHDNDAGDEAVAECPDCDGIGKVSAQVQDVAGWQPIETAPKDGKTILACWRGTEIYGAIWWEDGKWHEWDNSVDVDGMSHWMPLPAAPAKQEGGE